MIRVNEVIIIKIAGAKVNTVSNSIICRLNAVSCGDWPVIALDDLAAELDRPHQQRVLAWLSAHPAQVFVTATEPPPSMQGMEQGGQLHVFHVEHGGVRPA